MIAPEDCHGPLHIFYTDGPACAGVPFVAVDAPDYQPIPIQQMIPSFNSSRRKPMS